MVYPKIIGYIHICQLNKWNVTFDLIMDALKKHGLYNETFEIRVGIVTQDGKYKHNSRFDDSKIKIVTYGHCSRYERLTLEHMRESSEKEDVQYWYAHTKGISHFNGYDEHKKLCILDWINLLIYHNFEKWTIASEKLLSNDTYGCEYSRQHMNIPHYSGNFWWANSQYVRTLPSKINDGYCDPEFWILSRDGVLMCNIFSSGIDGGDHYTIRYPESSYKL